MHHQRRKRSCPPLCRCRFLLSTFNGLSPSTCTTRIYLKRHHACQERAASQLPVFQWETNLIVKCMAWPFRGRGNEWPGGRWWGRHSRHALRNANLSFTFFFFHSCRPSSMWLPLFFFLRKSDMFVAPTALVMERSLRRQSTHVVKECLSAEWRALLPLPPRPINLD